MARIVTSTTGSKKPKKETPSAAGSRTAAGRITQTAPAPPPKPTQPASPDKKVTLLRNDTVSPKTGQKLNASSGTATKGFYGGKSAVKEQRPGAGGGGGDGGGMRRDRPRIAKTTFGGSTGGGGGGTPSAAGSRAAGGRVSGGVGDKLSGAFKDPGLVGSHNQITNFDGSTSQAGANDGTFEFGGSVAEFTSGGGGTGSALAGREVAGLLPQLKGLDVEEVVRGARKRGKAKGRKTQ